MKPEEFYDRLDDARVVAAIAAAERRTSGEIRVFVSRRRLGRDDVLRRAEARFQKLGMTATAARNGVLIYLLPHDRKFAIVGDSGIHSKCGDAFWAEIAAGLRERLARGDFTEGVTEAIARAGEALAEHFPARAGDEPNELPDDVERD
jgi:uncharacterized membrane protein